MTKLQNISEKGNFAVRQLRQQKFRAGQPFMIYSKELPTDQIYLELPNGVIHVARIKKGERDFLVLRDLNQGEANSLRIKYKLV